MDGGMDILFGLCRYHIFCYPVLLTLSFLGVLAGLSRVWVREVGIFFEKDLELSRTSANLVPMKAKNNPKGTPRVRKTWRLDSDILKKLASYCKMKKQPE